MTRLVENARMRINNDPNPNPNSNHEKIIPKPLTLTLTLPSGAIAQENTEHIILSPQIDKNFIKRHMVRIICTFEMLNLISKIIEIFLLSLS